MPLSGHCLCGAVTYTAGEPVLVGYDHCDACQRQTGSTYSLVVVVKKETFQHKGPVKDFKKPGDSGKDVHRLFCTECGSPIAHFPDAAPDILAIKGGTLETSQKQALKPTHEIYTCDKLAFMTEKLEKPFEKMPQ
ncbi:DUF636 domain protein [Planoprotostelium fungivorum]|uniref:DUF636 domain protein n=2 Tax=Planoprotostelium fungivorum TaxID=1890364 RepID=A0A2P6MT82_9EUKA|nr:DUF636 domain protein [Planoprotostelium fungivorum]